MAQSSNVRGPPSMEFAGKGDKTEKYNLWKQRMDLFAQVSNKTGEDLVPYILQCLDDEGLKIYNTFDLTVDEKKKPEKIYEKFEERLNISKPNFRTARLDLHFVYQQTDETLDSFYIRCKEITKDCDFTEAEEKERIIEQLLASTPLGDYRKWLLSQSKDVTMEAVLAEGRKHETTLKSIKHLQDRSTATTPSSNIDATPKCVSAIKYKRGKPKIGQSKDNGSKCKRCGGNHRYGSTENYCPAKDAVCHYCKIKGHWEKCCIKKNKQNNQRGRGRGSHRRGRGRGRGRGVHDIGLSLHDSEDDYHDQFETVEYSMINIQTISEKQKSQNSEAYGRIQIRMPGDTKVKGRQYLRLKVDTGAQGNTLPLRAFREMMPNRLDRHGYPDRDKVDSAGNTTLTAYNGTKIKCFGSISLGCKYKDSKWTEAKFYIVDVEGPAISGFALSQTIGLVTMHCSINNNNNPISVSNIGSVDELKSKFPEQFDRIGNLPGKVKLHLKDDAVPFIDPPRKYSIHLKPKLKEELDKMEEQGVITKVKEHSDWCSSLAISIKKDGSLRICLDPRKLNDSLRRCPHRAQTLEEISYRFNQAKYFSKLDAKAGYWGCELEEDSQSLTTFRTRFGRYKFKKLPFGLNISQDVFQQKIDEILENCPGTIGIADDIVCFGKTEEEHDQNLLTLMNEAKQHGLVFNSNKCQIKKSQIEYFGIVLGSNGIQPDKQKVEDLKNMPTPENKAELQAFLGLITYLSPFIPNLSGEAEPIRKLLCKDTPFEWSEDHQHTFERLKTLISTEACLKYYDTEAPTYLMVDASLQGLGAALLQPDKEQDGSYSQKIRPVAFASKALTSAQRNYANIEREMSAITFGIKRLHTYLYNRSFTVLSDHKPLEMICRKPLTTAPPRLQAMLLAIQPYTYRVKYIPGKDIGLADAISRLPNPHSEEDMELDVKIENLQFTENITNQIRQCINRDPALNALKETIYNGWPESQQELPTALRDFWSYRDELSLEDGIILKGERIYIPEELRSRILTNLHTGHLGITKTQLRAKKDVFWPKINKVIEAMCKSCTTCQENQPAQSHQPLINTGMPKRPWSMIGTDLFQIDDDQYLIIADYYTKFPLVDKLPKPATSSVIAGITAKYCSIMGIPDVIRSDNGPHFVGQAYQNFISAWGINHITSSPRYPRSNGFIERQIKTVKSILKKTREAKGSEMLALLRWRTTPVDSHIQSPAELLFQRKVKDTLPSKGFNTIPNKEEIQEHTRHKQESQKLHHDSKARHLPPMYPGQLANHRDYQTGKWLPATVIKRTKEPNSYLIQTASGNLLRRNREHIREVPPSKTLPPPNCDNYQSATKESAVEEPHSPNIAPQEKIKQAKVSNEQKTVTRYGRTVKKPARFDDTT